MHDPEEKARRRAAIVAKVRRQQKISGHESPVPSFLNLITDKIIDIEMRLERMDLKNLEAERDKLEAERDSG